MYISIYSHTYPSVHPPIHACMHACTCTYTLTCAPYILRQDGRHWFGKLESTELMRQATESITDNNTT